MVNKQDYINSITQNIDIVKGDTLAFCFQLSGLGSNAEYTALSVNFAVAEHYGEDAIIDVDTFNGIELTDYNAESDTATFTVCVAPYMTKDLDLGRYYYDLQIADGDNVITLMRGIFTLVYEVKL